MNEAVEELKKKYDDMSNEIGRMEREVESAKNELQAQENVFSNSVQSVVDTLNSDKEKITKLYI